MTQAPPPIAPGPPPMAPELPGATAGLVLGICSIVFTVPVLGLILAFIGLQKSREAKRWAELHPGVYSNLGVAQAGFICSVIGLILGGLATLCTCGYIIILIVAVAAGGM